MDYESVIGLEVHVQLATKSKAFCGCSTEFGAQPNSQACPVCLGFPGVLPVLNKQALEYAIEVALALNCSIQNFIKFDRKNYFYPDLPKNYQISQYDLPLSKGGFLEIELDGILKRIGITRVHLEEDAGKLIHKENSSLVDFNRTGIPLLEIVSEPDINSPPEAYKYLISLKSILEYLGASSCDMEKGILRCDANISVREKGETQLGTKIELKNMNSFKAVKLALEFEIMRQIDTLTKKGKIVQETRLWDEKEGVTFSMRRKEGAHDYRYFPEPDLVPFIIEEEKIAQIKDSLPELPQARFIRFMKDYGLSVYDAGVLVAQRKFSDYFELCFRLYPKAKNLGNWLCGSVLGELNQRNINPDDIETRLKPESFVKLLKLVDEERLSGLAAKEVLSFIFETGQTPEQIIKERDLMQISDREELDGIVELIIQENPKSREAYLSGKKNALMFLVGQVMQKTKGKANPKVVQEILKRRLENA